MILGSYPCCEGGLSIAMPDGGPFWMPEDCPHCGARVWHFLTRVNPTTLLEADSNEISDHDPATKKISVKPGKVDKIGAAYDREGNALAHALGLEPFDP